MYVICLCVESVVEMSDCSPKEQKSYFIFSENPREMQIALCQGQRSLLFQQPKMLPRASQHSAPSSVVWGALAKLGTFQC